MVCNNLRVGAPIRVTRGRHKVGLPQHAEIAYYYSSAGGQTDASRLKGVLAYDGYLRRGQTQTEGDRGRQGPSGPLDDCCHYGVEEGGLIPPISTTQFLAPLM